MIPSLSIILAASIGWLQNGYHRKYFFILLLGGIFNLTPLPADDLVKSNFESSVSTYNPWAGVTDTGLIKVLPGKQPAIDNEGRFITPEFGPSVAVGDLNGDGLQDLVIADSLGFFWYFPNSGTPTQAKFTHGEIMPIWLGFPWGDPNYLGPDGANDIVPKIQLVDFAGDGKVLSLVAGNYVGRLFYLRNHGTSSQPDFHMPPDRAELIIPTHKKTNDEPTGKLWCNFLSPYLYDWFGTGNLDLIMGDGSYSANSIYLFTNQGARDRPIFTEDKMLKIIPGMGREHLTPQVVDWNNDGKPDIIAGERTGYLNLFLNTTTDPKEPTFDEGQHVKLGGKDTFGDLTTVTVCDLSANKLPNLIVSNSAGDIMYAQNSGKLGAPQFGDPVPIRGVNPFPKILRPIGWTLSTPFGSPAGVPHELLVCTNATVQEGFTPPPNTPFKNALRYYVYPIKNTFFTDFYYPADDGNEPHDITYDSGFQVREDVDYKVSFWVRSTGNIHDLSYRLRGWAHLPDDPIEEVVMGSGVPSSGSWNLFEDTIKFRLKNTKTKDNLVGVGLDFQFHSQGEVYLDDVWIRSDEQK